LKFHELTRPGLAPDSLIAAAVGKVEPPNINVASTKKTSTEIVYKQLQHLVYGQYRPAFNEVMQLLNEKNYRRPELADIGIANETNLFLSWVRLTYAPGEDSCEAASTRSKDARRAEIDRLGLEWVLTTDSKVDAEYKEWLARVKLVFGGKLTIQEASKEELIEAIMSIHAFYEQLRFVKGGATNLPKAFWAANNDDVSRVKKTLTFFLYDDKGDFTHRLHDILYDPAKKVGLLWQVLCA
jgi:hypothetical protein